MLLAFDVAHYRALAIRLAATAYVGFSRVQFPDGPAYLRGARSLATTGRYPLRTDQELHLFRPPGYPAFLVAVTLGHPDFIPAGKIANALASALVAVLIAALSARIVRRRGVAIATGVSTAICPTQVLVATDIQTEPLFLVLLLCTGYLLLAAQDRPSSGLGLLSGAGLALAALTRPSALALSPLLLAPLFDRRYPRGVRTHIAASAVLGFTLTLAPWTMRNALVFHELILVNGPALKVLIEEEFGDGIMSAIDFDMDITRKADPKGDRVQIGMTGKFLPFKYYGATGNALAYGLKEE